MSITFAYVFFIGCPFSAHGSVCLTRSHRVLLKGRHWTNVWPLRNGVWRSCSYSIRRTHPIEMDHGHWEDPFPLSTEVVFHFQVASWTFGIATCCRATKTTLDYKRETADIVDIMMTHTQVAKLIISISFASLCNRLGLPSFA